MIYVEKLLFGEFATLVVSIQQNRNLRNKDIFIKMFSNLKKI